MKESPGLGIIGGSGLYHLAALADTESVDVETPWGRPSASIRIGTIAGSRVAFLSRHGVGHALSPSEVPYAANVCAMKMIGVQRLVSISAVGSLREDIPPRSFVIPDQTIDRTHGRKRTFFDGGVVAHVGMAAPFCSGLGDVLETAARAGGLPVRRGGTYVCIEGPQFSTRAESRLYQSWDASIVGMTALPEARLAREAGLCYACLAMVTDYDVWRDPTEDVSVELVLANLIAMTDAVQSIVVGLAGRGTAVCTDDCEHALASAIITAPDVIPEAVRRRVAPIAGSYLNPGPDNP